MGLLHTLQFKAKETSSSSRRPDPEGMPFPWPQACPGGGVHLEQGTGRWRWAPPGGHVGQGIARCCWEAWVPLKYGAEPPQWACARHQGLQRCTSFSKRVQKMDGPHNSYFLMPNWILAKLQLRHKLHLFYVKGGGINCGCSHCRGVEGRVGAGAAPASSPTSSWGLVVGQDCPPAVCCCLGRHRWGLDSWPSPQCKSILGVTTGPSRSACDSQSHCESLLPPGCSSLGTSRDHRVSSAAPGEAAQGGRPCRI